MYFAKPLLMTMPGTIVLKRAANNEFYFVFQSPDGQVLLSSDRYLYKISCLEAVQTARNCSTKQDKLQTGMATNGGQFFVLRGADNEIICTSEIYASSMLRNEAMEFVNHEMANAPLTDMTG
jgi:uncharacterized protein YegP (UPF0339 family)